MWDVIALVEKNVSAACHLLRLFLDAAINRKKGKKNIPQMLWFSVARSI